MSLDLNLLCIAICGVLFAFITALSSWMLPQSIGVPYATYNVDDALSTRSCAQNFVGALFQVLRLLLPCVGGLTRTFQDCLPLDVDGTEEAFHTRDTEHIQRLSQVVNGPGSRIGLYFRVVGTHVLGVVPSFYSC